MNYGLAGTGRMGVAIDAVARERGHREVARWDGAALRGGDPLVGVEKAAVAFEFTHGEAAERNALRLVEAGAKVVCGTTGWTPSQRLRDAVAAAGGGLIVAPNFSVGVHLFFRAAREAARLLAGSGLCQPWIVEHHHRGKRDAPSGTARELARVVCGAVPGAAAVEGTIDGPVESHVVQVVGVRAGYEPGTHRLGFDGEHDRLLLEHQARGRGGFALGAVLAAEWLETRSGVRSFDEVLDAWLEGEASRR